MHRDNDLPASIGANGSLWARDGELHRDGDLPAVIRTAGIYSYQEWYQNGKLHRDNDLPAIIPAFGSGYLWWYQKGNLIPEFQVQKQLRARIHSENARKIVFMYSIGFLPRDVGIVVCNY